MLANPTLRKTQRPHLGSIVVVGAVLVLALVAAIVCAWLMVQTVASYYAHRLYPNVTVLDLELGRLTVEEALALLDGAAVQPDIGALILDDGEYDWSIPWSDAGLQLDKNATVQAALAIGHSEELGWRDQARVWLGRHDVAPVFSMDAEGARRALERLAPSLATAPTDATLHLPQQESDSVIAVPGQPGRELDIETTLARIQTTADGGDGQNAQVTMVFRSVPPRVADVTQLQTHVEGLLKRHVVISTYDVLSDETFTWTLGRGDIITWLRLAPSAGDLPVTLDEGAIQATLGELTAELGDGRGFRWAEAAEQVTSAFEAGGGSVTLYLTHPQRTYTVQTGDSLSSIATAFGFTAWHMLRANPGVDPDWLMVGQELTIPSQDELTPYMPVPGKRIVVSTVEQRLRAYENGELVFDWPVSTGIAESPTHTGVFQVLSKEAYAYASLWDLWMPHFVAIYEAGPGFYNGFHGLPTLSSGRRLWEGLLGSPVSYGCIILGLEEAEALYGWVEVGVGVVVE